MKRPEPTLQFRLLLAIFISILAMVIIAFAGIFSMQRSVDKLETVLTDLKSLEKNADLANLDFKRQVQEWKNVLLRGQDPERMERYWGSFLALQDDVQNRVQALVDGLSDYPELQATAEQFLIDHRNMGTAYGEGRQAFIRSGFDHTAGDAAVSGIDRAPSAAMEDLGLQLSERANSATTEASQHADTTLIVSLSLAVACSLVILGAILMFVRLSIIKPIHQLKAGVQHIQHGQYDQPIELNRRDELGDLARTIDFLRSFLHEMINDLERNATALQNAVGKLDTMSGGIARTTAEQSDLSHQVATAIEEMEAASREVAGNASETAEATSHTEKLARSGGDSMQRAQQTMQKLVNDTESTAESITRLAQESENVGSVLTVIKGIAEQTNLLALNAAIEAARAGEQGRGFAVVADEVRSLAEKTQQSTVEIQNILESIRGGAEESVRAMETGRVQTESTASQVVEVGTHLDEILVAITQINEKNQQIATAAEEQTSVAGSLSELIMKIRNLAEDTSGESRDAHALSEELSTLASDFNRHLTRLRSGQQ
ncbi:hypothetical protein BGP77_03605 [Saccharospirillum sp. MSK14-1]|uniref:methyl-accepting chemotaxis protein n=1 Tax=Saccharospirillum sp. MSK14-1 TaxID=1897632 RepID=UPI000D37207B|nr:methyl-accepting chemotaxis protein [Saccharospirillum sp. MSK14-1]PTY36396.1 hypothetical protein BGP77_03605 [Saccharospirillum sp. MSK14-1]